MPIQTGTKLGAYQVGQLIGQGAMGSVYSARHEALDRTAAVKVMNALDDDPAAAVRFRREGQAIAHLRHPNILTVYDYGEYEGTPYMIVEHIAGGSLAGRLKTKGRPDVPTAIRFLRGMAAGLDHAHQMGVVHRDVKPANVLMGPADSPVLADFGLAKLQQQATMTASGLATGTPAYMAPEQISGSDDIGPPADVYALATVAYEILTGHRPYESGDVMQLLMAKMRDDPPPPTQYDPTLPRRVDGILLRGLARKPAARWPNCTAMVEALAAVLEPKPELFAVTQSLRRARFDWMSWAWVAFPVAAIVTIVVLFVILPRLRPAPAAPPGPSVSTIVPCPVVSPSPPQLAVIPNPAVAGESVTYTATGFDANSPIFIVVDSVGDCTIPTQGTVVFTTGAHADPLTTDPTALPTNLLAGDYQLRACVHNVGSNPTGCFQVPFSVTAPPSPAAPTPSPSPTQ